MKSITLLKNGLHRQGGLEKYTKKIVLAFRKQNFDVTVLTSGPFNHFPEDPSIHVHAHQIRHKMSLFKVIEFDHFCKKYTSDHPTDIVFGMDRNQFQTHLRAGNGVHQSYLKQRQLYEGGWKSMRHHFNPLHRLILNLEKKAFESPHLRRLFTNSYMVRDEILNFYKVDPKKISVIHNGVEWNEMQTSFSGWQEKRSEISNPKFHFLFVGHDFQRKGLKNLLYGLSRLSHREFQFSIIGKDKNLLFYQNLAQKLKLEKQIFFFNEIKDVLPFYQIADCLVIPSFYDPFANVTIEALAMGLHVVTSRTNGGHEILNAENGTIIENLQDVDSVAAALERALKFPKSAQSAERIRNGVKHLDFSHQLSQLVTLCLETVCNC